MLRSIRKNVQLTHHIISCVIYKFRCQWYADSVGRTGQRLEARINQYVPAIIRKGKLDILHIHVNVSDSAKAEHLIQQCARFYSPNTFSLLSKAITDYHVKVLQSLH